ncbi:hypothetical protein SpCBS45565_g02316 [Spizellomyces sp. 'palustris']|nr:hypothetical protein SpCBS45565_g02316 [Spizellomyces sp. 'palustris']
MEEIKASSKRTAWDSREQGQYLHPVHTDHSNAGIQIMYRSMSIRLEQTNNQAAADSDFNPPDIREIKIHLNKPEDVFTRFSSHPEIGLDKAAVERKSAEGKNIISEPPKKHWKLILQYVFGGFNFLMWIALIVTVLSYQPLGSMDGATPAAFNLGVAGLIFLVIAVSATFYALVDWRAGQIMKAINNVVANEATVIRDGLEKTIPASDVVVGDILTLRLGQRVPADVRLIQVSSDLAFDRMLLTGESDPIPGTVEPTDTNPLETRNLAFASTFVVQGSGRGVVYAIGDRSIMGHIVRLSGHQKAQQTSLQKELGIFTAIISGLALGLFSLAMLVWGTWIKNAYPDYATPSVAIINAIGCLTAFVPQGLPVCVALTLTIVAKRMSRRQILVKNLATVETLGCMSVLCSDKTGTLTLGQMNVERCGFLNRTLTSQEATTEREMPAIKDMNLIARLCNGAVFEGDQDDVPIEDRKIKGDATDSAILRFGESLPHTPMLLSAYEKLYEIPFNSKNKWMLTVVRDNTKSSTSPVLMVKGAPDILFKKCSSILLNDGTTAGLDSTARETMSLLQEQWSGEGQRVLALCKKDLGDVKIDWQDRKSDEVVGAQVNDLTLVALLGIRDPPRPEVKKAIETIHKAHVRVFMVTGDFKNTAVAIAKQVGIVETERVDTLQDLRSRADIRAAFANIKRSLIKPDEDRQPASLVITGEELHGMTSEDWDVAIGGYHSIVFARTTPEQKLLIVEETKKRGDNTVAVTGDGVNDAPALKAADIGVAMGAGSDVAKETAAMILLNNDFTAIPYAIENGRLVFDNLKKVIMYLMPIGTYVEFMAVMANVFLGVQIPLSSFLQIFFCVSNDIVMSTALMFEKPESDLMVRKPRNARKDRLTDYRFFMNIYLFIGLMAWPCAMGMFFLYMSEQRIHFHDIVFAYSKWTDGYLGYTIDELTHFLSVGQCIYYVTMVMFQFGAILAVRNRSVSILQSNPFYGPRRNLRLFAGMAVSICIAIIALYVPFIQNLFGTAPIPTKFWFIPLSFAAGVLIVDEIRKALVRVFPKSILAKLAW